MLPPAGPREVDELACRERRREPLARLVVDPRPRLRRDRRVLAQEVAHDAAPLRLPSPSELPDSVAPRSAAPSTAASSAASPCSTMSPSWKRMPRAISRHRGTRRSRNSRSMQKCLNSSPWASAMMARASRSLSSARRCWYQPIASASSVRDVQRRANVRTSSESSFGGSWYWSVGIRASCHRASAHRSFSTRTGSTQVPVSYTHLRAHETDSYLVCRLLLEKKK